MSTKIRAAKDIWAPGHKTGFRTLVARAGQLVDEKDAVRYGGAGAIEKPAKAAPADVAPAVGKYDDLKVKALRKILDERGFDHADLTKKQDLVDALEYDDESRGA